MGKYGLSEERYQQIFTRLNEEQKQVVLHGTGPALTLSSAGSGKTSVVVAKIFHLLHKLDVNPSSILAITFTKKAAEEMKARMIDAFEGEHEDLIERIRFKTIHSFAYELYTKTMFSMDPMFDRPSIMTSNMGKFFPAFLKRATKTEPLLYNTQLDYFTAAVGFLKRSMTPIEVFEKQVLEKAAELNPYSGRSLPTFERKGKLVYEPDASVVAFYKFYEQWKADHNCIDFDDMLTLALKSLTDDPFTKYSTPIIERLEHIIVDESQDTSTVSFKIVDCLKAMTDNVTLVGDTRQGIYLFAGADPKNILKFRDDHVPSVYDLRINYRSTKAIVENANKLIEKAKGVVGAPAIAFNQGECAPVQMLVSMNEVEEADRIAEAIDYHIQAEGVSPRDIAVLYRVHSQAVALEDALFSLRIPYYSYSKRAFYERKEILDVLAYLKVLGDPISVTKNDFKRIMNKPNNFMTAAVLDEIFEIKREQRCSVLSAMSQASPDADWAAQALMKFHAKLQAGVRFAASAPSVSETIGYVLNTIGYLAYMKELLEINEGDVDLMGNFDAIRGVASRFTSIKDFLAHIESLKDESEKDEDGDYVKLMTIHASKGREWDHVYVAGICDRIYPFHKCATFEDVEQERRVMYVAVTRPRKFLYLSNIDMKYGRYTVRPSPYIFDMNVDYHAAKARAFTGRTVGDEKIQDHRA